MTATLHHHHHHHPSHPAEDDSPLLPSPGAGSPYPVMTYDDDLLKMTPAGTPDPGPELDPPYRCPVSTPANFVRPSPRVRRSKPMPVSLEINLTPRSPGKRSAGGKPPRPAAAMTHRSPNAGISRMTLNGGGGGEGGGGGGGGGGGVPIGGTRTGGGGPGGLGRAVGVGGVGTAGALNSRALSYYYVDRGEERREEAEMNTFWLRALCAQPVTEILDKYKRRSDLRRTRLLWSRTYTTPGERSLLRAWERNGPLNALRAASQTVGVPRTGGARAAPDSQPRSWRGGTRSKRASSGSGSPSAMPRHQSEPFDRSRGYPSDEGEDETEDEDDAGVGSSTVSADVTDSSPRSSRYRQSPRQRSPADSGYRKHGQLQPSPEGQRGPSGTAVHPVEPAYHLSEHFQVSLPSVSEGWRGRREMQATPTSFSPPRDRRHPPLGELSAVTSQSGSEVWPKEWGAASSPASSSLPPETPRAQPHPPRPTLPAIGRP
ncbi:uncharacterized protein LOC143283512 [Babylonia areolata]|uniref:uncharacterized protein LOC143283512 n=1 Tax=Babylonia areolata TaxID=304850 RepID=UPI003FD17EC9